ncbi:MAG TPA: cytochrome c [Chitinophagaceae bacterium]|jgi:hypothetical protein|nr:cytochrome c [Chitinophagaceae bacterium]
MRRYFLLIFLFIFYSCDITKEPPPKPFSNGMLALQSFFISSDSDTTIQTLHGSVIRISAASFNVTGEISLVIREAFTAAEILAAGMITESNGKPLRSGGMIYLNAMAKGQPVELLKPIKVSIANQYFDSSMQVFKGVETDSSGINWVEPSPVDTTPQSTQWERGKMLFGMCRSCHYITKYGTGPALKDVEYRAPWINNRKKLYRYIRNWNEIAREDPAIQRVLNYTPAVMQLFPNLSDVDIDAILDYIKNESNNPLADKNNYPEMDTANSVYDSEVLIQKPCKDDTIYTTVPKSEISFLNGDQTDQQFDTLPIIKDATSKTNPPKAETMEGLRSGFTDPNTTSGMYDFEIKTLGWYNIDAYVEGYGGSSYVKLWVQLQLRFEMDMHVYLFIPRNKMLSVMNEYRDGKGYFNKINDGIPLFLKDKAVLLAFGSKDDKMAYGITEFVVSGEQTIKINVKETTEREMREALSSKSLDGIDLGIEKKEMKIIKQNCDELLVKKDTLNKQ